MTLLELLVKELPKRGGWPEGAVEAGFLCSNTTLYFVDANGDCPSEWRMEMDSEVEDNDIEISADQYQSALAESQKVEWSGDGLPPVGCECERSWCGDNWLQCKVIFISNETVVVKLATREAAYCVSEVKFRPLRSEVDKKRDDRATAIDGFICGFRKQKTGSNKELAYALTDYLALIDKLQ